MFVPDLKAIRLHLDFLNAHVRGKCPCHVHGTDLIPDLYEILRRAEMNEEATANVTFAAEAVAVLRAYRGRIHTAYENEEGDTSEYFKVHSVHRDLMDAADAVHHKAKLLGLLELRPREYHA